jgi:hypothetical protein
MLPINRKQRIPDRRHTGFCAPANPLVALRIGGGVLDNDQPTCL